MPKDSAPLVTAAIASARIFIVTAPPGITATATPTLTPGASLDQPGPTAGTYPDQPGRPAATASTTPGGSGPPNSTPR
jgi:hypothetical protein